MIFQFCNLSALIWFSQQRFFIEQKMLPLALELAKVVSMGGLFLLTLAAGSGGGSNVDASSYTNPHKLNFLDVR
jgi:hypothetical protein